MSSPAPETTPVPGPKQVLVLRKDLKMPPGKLAAQAAHCAQRALTHWGEAKIRVVDGRRELVVPLDDTAFSWLDGAEYKKVALAVKSEAELLELHQAALAAGLRCALIVDNGHTVFNGAKTHTALAIGPHDEELLQPLTGHLPLY